MPETPTTITATPLIKPGKRHVRLLWLTLLPLLSLPFLLLDAAPRIAPDSLARHDYLAIARNLVYKGLQNGGEPGVRKVMILTAADLDAAANYFLARKKLGGLARCAIDQDRLNLEASLPLTVAGIRVFVNGRVTIDDAEPHPRIRRLKLGSLSIPAPVIGWITAGVSRWTPLARYRRIAEQMIQEMRIRDGILVVSLNWNQNLLAKAQSLVLDLADEERLLVYHEELRRLVSQPDLKRFVRLSRLLPPLFALAKQRSEAGNDAVAENRALLLVLGAYVNGRSLTAALPGASEPNRLGVLLNRRIDTAQHFAGSAAMTVAGTNTLTELLGLAKEMNDTHGGSGFSFVDLAADQAGSLLGKLATRSAEDARRVQRILSEHSDERLFMPSVQDLPENLDPAGFRARFKDLDSPEFHAVRALIGTRIRALPLFQ